MLNIKRKYENSGYSVLLIALLFALVFFAVSRSEDPYSGILVWAVIVFCHYLGLAAGVVLIVLRFLKILKDRENFFYVFITVLNILVGIFNLVYILIADSIWAPIWYQMSFNLLVGTMSVIDIFLWEYVVNGSSHRNTAGSKAI